MEQRDPRQLTPIEAIRAFPRWEKDDPQRAAFVADIRQVGVLTPIQITVDDQVVDGETRRQAAVEVGLETVPVVIVGQDQIATVVFREIRRRHLTKSATAYLVYPMLENAHLEAQKGAVRNLRKGQCFSVADSIGDGTNRVEDIAVSLGVSVDLFQQSAKVHAIFSKDQDYRVQMEPHIISGEVGLGAVIAGYGGRQTTAGQERNHTQYLRLIQKAANSWSAWGRYWQNLDDQERHAAKVHIRGKLADLPEDIRADMSRELRRLEHTNA